MNKFQGYKAVVGCILLGIVTIGYAGVYGVMLPSIAAGLNCSFELLYYVFTISTLTTCVGSFLLAGIIKKIGAKNALIIGLVSNIINYSVVGFGTNPYLVVGITALGGICNSFAGYATYSIIVNKWFIKNREKMLSVAIGIISFGTPLATFIAGRLLTAVDYHMAYGVFVASMVVLGAIGLFLIKDPEKCGQKPLGWEEREALEKAAAQNVDVPTDGLSMKEIWKSPAMYCLLISSFVFGMAYEGVFSYAPSFFAIYGMDEGSYANLITIGLFIVTIYVIINGTICEKLGSKVFVLISSVCLIASNFLLYLWPNSLSIALIVVALVFAALGAPLEVSYAGLVTPDLFGNKEFDRVTNLAMGLTFCGIAVAPFIINRLSDMRYFYLLCSIASAVGLACGVIGLVTSPIAKRRKAANK